MTIFVAHLTLVLLCRALESLHMYGVTTFVAVVSSSMWLLVVIGFLDLIGCCILCSLVLFWPTSWSSLLVVSICGNFSPLMSHQIDLSRLWVTGYLFDVPHSCL